MDANASKRVRQSTHHPPANPRALAPSPLAGHTAQATSSAPATEAVRCRSIIVTNIESALKYPRDVIVPSEFIHPRHFFAVFFTFFDVCVGVRAINDRDARALNLKSSIPSSLPSTNRCKLPCNLRFMSCVALLAFKSISQKLLMCICILMRRQRPVRVLCPHVSC